MRIIVHAHPRAKEEKVEKISVPDSGSDQKEYKVSVKEPPVKGLANAAIAKALAQYFNIALPRVRLVSGFSSKTKIFEIY
ncbi:MAG: DUF167 domain-containing protein [Candidatus Harrisonbacteria bacterium]|nr:DUF167 domain-containing protein [Candidatus Harrisonbacteria bacterium]